MYLDAPSRVSWCSPHTGLPNFSRFLQVLELIVYGYEGLSHLPLVAYSSMFP